MIDGKTILQEKSLNPIEGIIASWLVLEMCFIDFSTISNVMNHDLDF